MLTDEEVEKVAGGAGDWWQQFAKGSYLLCGPYIVYTCAGGDVLNAICIRFGVARKQICQWNNLKNPGIMLPNQKLTIYFTILR